MSNQLVNETKDQSHCINALRVFDWIVACPVIRKKIPVFYKKKTEVIQTEICRDFSFNSAPVNPVLLWEDAASSNFSGTISVLNQLNSSPDSMIQVIVNGEPLFFVGRGETRSLTLPLIQSVSVNVTSGEAVEGALRLTLNQKIMLPQEKSPQGGPIKVSECFFTDSCGKQVDPCTEQAIECTEITERSGRKSSDVILPNGKTATLQQIRIRKKGFICIGICDCFVGPIPFFLEESFWLCAPPGTKIACKVNDARCDAYLLPGKGKEMCYVIDVSIELQQEVKVVGETTIALEAEQTCPSVKKMKVPADCRSKYGF